MALTVEGIRTAKPAKGDRWLSDKSTQRDSGRLLLRVSPNGSKRFYFRYAPRGSHRAFIPMDAFTGDPRPGAMTLEQARAKAAEYSALHRAPQSRDVKAYLEQRDSEARAGEAAEARRIAGERSAAEAARVYNLRALAAEYADKLEASGKHRTAYDVRNIFKNHLNKKAVADRPAKDVERAEITALVRELVEAERGRTAAKMRSYLRAAYAMAMRAEGDASAPSKLIAFKVTANPV